MEMNDTAFTARHDFDLSDDGWSSDEDLDIVSMDDSPIDNRHWSRSPGLWLVAIYLVLFLIRPWELLVPALGAIRFERMYAIAMIAAESGQQARRLYSKVNKLRRRLLDCVQQQIASELGHES